MSARTGEARTRSSVRTRRAVVRGAGAVAAALLLCPAVGAQLAIRGELVHTMTGPPIRDGVVLVRDGKIERVGPAVETPIPAGYRELRAAVVTPGLIDAHSTAGVSGVFNVPHDQDQLDKTAPIQPELRAVDAYNALDPLVAWLRTFGITTLHTGHGPGALASGQTMIVKTRGDSVEEALVKPAAMVAMTLGPQVSDNFESPGTRAKGVALLRTQLVKAQEYRRKKEAKDVEKRPDRDLALEALAQVLARELPALVTAQRVPEILAALRLQKEFGFDLVLDGGAEAYLVLDAIGAAKVPVIVHPMMARLGGETRNASLETPAKLRAAGIPFTFQSGYEGYVPKTRVVLLEAALAAANGLAPEDTLRALTIDAAKLLRIDDRVGSLAPGKDADLALFDGDPLEYTTHACTVVIEGEIVSDVCR